MKGSKLSATGITNHLGGLVSGSKSTKLWKENGRPRGSLISNAKVLYVGGGILWMSKSLGAGNWTDAEIRALADKITKTLSVLVLRRDSTVLYMARSRPCLLFS